MNEEIFFTIKLLKFPYIEDEDEGENDLSMKSIGRIERFAKTSHTLPFSLKFMP